MVEKVSLADKFALFTEQWAPRLAAQYNGNEVRLAKLEGDFHWHAHPDTDELFFVVEGELDIEFRDGTQTLRAGEMIVVPRGTEHCPRAKKGEVKVMIIDAEGTPNTGDEATAFTPIKV